MKIEISDELVEQGRQLLPIGLVEKLLTRRLVNRNNFVTSFQMLWQGRKEVGIKILMNNHFVFTYERPGDIDLGLSTWNPGPIIELYSSLENLKASFVSSELGLLQHIHFWVQAFHIPPEGMTSGIGWRLGQANSTDGLLSIP